MGNVISDPVVGDIQENTLLGQYIINWALTNYPPKKPKNMESLMSQGLKKRACCTKQTSIPIGIADVDLKTNKIVNNTVRIPIFGDAKDINGDNCNLGYTDTKKSYLGLLNTNGKLYCPEETCKEFYLQFGKQVKANRAIHTNEGNRHYGINDLDNDKLDTRPRTYRYNQFVDCNCINGFYNNLNALKAKPGKPMPDPMVMEQTIDPRCYNNANVTFKDFVSEAGKVCVNIIDVEQIQATNKGSIQIDQTCDAEDKEEKRLAKEAKDKQDKQDKEDREKKEREDREKKERDDREKKEREDREKQQGGTPSVTPSVTPSGGETGGGETGGGETTDSGSSNMMLIIGGVGLLLCIIFIIIFFVLSGSKKKKSKK
jgi:hypothetical protein